MNVFPIYQELKDRSISKMDKGTLVHRRLFHRCCHLHCIRTL